MWVNMNKRPAAGISDARCPGVFIAARGTYAGRHRWLVTRFRELIETAFREGKSLADYASALNVSQSRLRSACLSVTEQSPMQLVHARILLEAKRQLLYTSISVSEIAYGLGFDDQAYFTRVFSQRTGMSPRAFRSPAARQEHP